MGRVGVQSSCWVRRRGGTKLTLGAFSQIPLGKKIKGDVFSRFSKPNKVVSLDQIYKIIMIIQKMR